MPKRKQKDNTVVHKMLRKYFGDLEIQDAKMPLLLIPTEADFKSAVRKDPQKCGLSRCVGRMFGASMALFFKRFAYIDLLGPDGVKRIYRFAITGPALEQLAAFDRSQAVRLGKSITLRPPAPQETLAGMRKRNVTWRRSEVGRAIAAEHKALDELRSATREVERTTERYQEVSEAQPASSPKFKEAKQQLDAAQTRLRKARTRADTAVERAKRLRTHSFRPGRPPAPRQFDLTVRNASGFFSKAGKAA